MFNTDNKFNLGDIVIYNKDEIFAIRGVEWTSTGWEYISHDGFTYTEEQLESFPYVGFNDKGYNIEFLGNRDMVLFYTDYHIVCYNFDTQKVVWDEFLYDNEIINTFISSEGMTICTVQGDFLLATCTGLFHDANLTQPYKGNVGIKRSEEFYNEAIKNIEKHK